MNDPTTELKIRAELLQKRIGEGDAASLARLRVLPELRRADGAALTAAAREARRKHCLAVVARECGFSGWEHALRVLDAENGDPSETDLGTLLVATSPGASGVLHAWFAAYDEARAALEAHRGRGEPWFLLGYKTHFFLADAAYVQLLGLSPDDPDWEAIGWDWARPANRAARARLFTRRLDAVRPSS